ncbi:hypothetical protein SAMN05421823_109135 [Catalinimonas alkaloidigena]|uniref:DUF2089 family protein n=1 Tax=Catalinimonas alkaloidigena TaxID=1075417 RepID=A0A1G9PC81_9BACT|nr:DUF2089 family protein [Catalinimonas alkaloidigena]SDL95827.1 hypothetical protein SAMN05421823_109135 [Catalinimonas alkaloidigena]
MPKKLPLKCPSCETTLKVESLQCTQCATRVVGLFDLPLLTRLSPDDQRFVVLFLKASGSLKEMAKQLGYSYPTVRNMLDDLIARIHTLESETNPSNE